MRRLVIDTATRACSVALFEGDECTARACEEIGRGHAERLVPMIAALPERGRADSIHVNVGPGSFTGIRVGVSAARALALAWQAECHGYGCLDLVAAMAAATLLRPFDVVMIGGHGEYFCQSFRATTAGLVSVPKSLPIDQAVRHMHAEHVAGDAAQDFVAARGWGQALCILPDAQYWHLLDAGASLPPSPAYFRGADAKLPGSVAL